MQTFTTWASFQEHAVNFTGGRRLFSSQGIYHFTNGTTILKSIDGVVCYKDDFTNLNSLKYTLYGLIGDQNKNEKRFNWKLLNEERTIYVMEVPKKGEWTWLGRYQIDGELEELEHPDKTGKMRKIYRITLKKVTEE